MKMLKNAMLVAFMAIMLCLPLVVGAQQDPLGLGAVGQELQLGDEDIRVTIGRIINAALGFLGVVAIIIVLIGGFKYMTSGGDDTKVKSARGFIISGIIGLAIILSAYAITAFVINQLVGATTGS